MTRTEQMKSFEELVEFIKTWRAWSGDEQYDFGGMTSLLGACLDNLQQFALDAELKELEEFLEPNQILFLKTLASRLAEPFPTSSTPEKEPAQS